jgi:hypothetical protein
VDKAGAIATLTQKLVEGRSADTAKPDRVRDEAETKSDELAVSLAPAAV